MTIQSRCIRPASRLRTIGIGAALLAGIGLTCAQPTFAASPAPAAAAAATPAAASPSTSGTFLDMDQLQQVATRQGIRVDEIHLKGKLAEVEGYDKQNREVEMAVDRRSGEILSRHTSSYPSSHASVATPGHSLSLAQIQKIVTDQGLTLKELEYKRQTIKVEGYDKRHREVKLHLDRSTGKVLSRHFDD